MMNRKCIANIWEHSDNNTLNLVQHHATLISWGIEIDQTYGENYTVAIVELDNGHIATCIPSNIKILDTCPICGKVMSEQYFTYKHYEYNCTCGHNTTKYVKDGHIVERIETNE